MENSPTSAYIPVQVHAASLAAREVHAFVLRRPDGVPLPAFTAGAHIELQLPGGLLRHYSLANAPGETQRWVIAVHKAAEGRGGSRWLHEHLRVGDVLMAGTPRNHFPLEEAAPHSVLVAGGIGITPLLAMARRLEAIGRPWQLFYAARTRSHAAFVEDLLTLDGGRRRVHLHFDDEQPGRMNLPAIVAAAPEGAHFYCCGPAPMLAAFAAATQALASERVHTEVFQAPASAPAPAKEGGFEIELARNGRCLAVPPGQSILDTLLAAGVEVPWSCGEGFCGSCATRVLAGRPDHRDTVLGAAERARNDQVLVCCSGSLDERLVLDL